MHFNDLINRTVLAFGPGGTTGAQILGQHLEGRMSGRTIRRSRLAVLLSHVEFVVL